MEKIKLSKKVLINDIETDEIEIDLDKLTANDLIVAEQEVRALGETAPSVLVTMRYQAVVAAKAAGMSSEEFLQLGARDFKNAIKPVMVFLLV